MDICRDPRDMGHLPIPYYPHHPTRTLIAMAISAMVKLFCWGSFYLYSPMGVELIPTLVGWGLVARNRLLIFKMGVVSQFRYVSKK